MRFRRSRPGAVAPLLAAGSRMSSREYRQWLDVHTWDPSRETDLTVQSDLGPAAWLGPLLIPDSFEVRMTAPQGYQAYARVFFPFVSADLPEDGEIGQEHVTWTQMAHRNGKAAHALMEQETIRPGPGAADEYQTGDGLTSEQLGALVPILIRHTSSSSGWFLLWDGFGDLNERAFRHDGPKVRHSMRSYYLLRGPLGSYGDFPDNPSYWWPDDRAWCVSTDVDFAWAYVAGSAACLDEVLAEPVIDALATRPENPARSGMDVINDPEGTVPRSS